MGEEAQDESQALLGTRGEELGLKIGVGVTRSGVSAVCVVLGRSLDLGLPKKVVKVVRARV